MNEPNALGRCDIPNRADRHKCYLEHWSETSSTGDHANGAAHVGCVVELALGSTSVDGVTNGEFTEHFGDVSLRIGLSRSHITTGQTSGMSEV